jgi:ATP-binding cassette subfamily B protein
MLPLEKLSDEAQIGFKNRGVDVDKIDICMELDLNLDGDFGYTWIAADMTDKKLHLLSITSNADTFYKNKINSTKEALGSAKKTKKSKTTASAGDLYKDAQHVVYDLTQLSRFYVDNFMSSNRLLCKEGVIELEIKEEDKEKDKDKPKDFHRRKEDKNTTGKTITLAYTTNARKKKLFAFMDILDRLKKNEEVKADDPIFEQFNMKCPKCGEVYKDQTRRICDNCTNQNAVLKRLMQYLAKYKATFIVVIFCMVASSAVTLINPLISASLIDDVIADSGKWHFLYAVYIFVGVIFGMAVLSLGIGILQNRFNAHLSTRVTLNMKMDIFTAMQSLSLSFFNSNQTGRLITRVNYDADRIRSFLIDSVPSLIINGLNFLGLIVICLIMNWKLTLIVFIPVPIIVLMFRFRLPSLWRAYTKEWRSSSSLNAFLNDALSGVRVVKAFAKEAEESHRFYGYSERLYSANLNTNMIIILIFPIIGLLMALSSNAIWGIGGQMVIGKTMTYGQFGAYFSYLGMIFGPLNFFTQFTSQMTQALNSAQRMFEIIDTVPEIVDAPDAVHKDRIDGSIEFKKVCFHYTPNRPILKNVSLKINQGDHIGLVGHTGSGKSTIANLINRLYDVISGSIHIDDVNVKQLTNLTLRKNISIVSQEIFLFRGTIMDNIRYARPDASMEEVIAAAKVANAHNFILRLPEGYQTVIGTGSRSLSGGECQRLSIARALLLNPVILILDEATAAMDTETERQIQDALNRLVTGRTTITIAHRLSTLKECNYLYAIENGEIAEEGTHVELIAKKGLYYRLYTLQSEAMKKVLQGM